MNNIPYIVFESMSVRLERTIRRLWILCIILVIVSLGTNIGWICYEMQYKEVSVTKNAEIETDDESTAITNIDGTINYGED